jgi:hypothetical protein
MSADSFVLYPISTIQGIPQPQAAYISQGCRRAVGERKRCLEPKETSCQHSGAAEPRHVDSAVLQQYHAGASAAVSANDTFHVLQEVTGREDSESYAKRTITEIETCLGFTFHGADDAEEAPAEAISTNELEVSIHPGIICMRSILYFQSEA